MLRITSLDGADSTLILRLEGKLLEPWVDEVRRAYAMRTPRQLDLSALTYVDAAGARLLRELLHEGAVICACSGFVSALLERDET
jgi:hypothetical protein